MTMVRLPRCPDRVPCRGLAGVATAWGVLALALAVCQPASGQGPAAHYLPHGMLPPGAIGRVQLQRGGPLPGHYQPVRITAPQGVEVALLGAVQGEAPRPAPREAGLLVGQVYRLRVTNIPLQEGREVFPTLELIDRVYPPPGTQRRFAVPVDLLQEDLQLALEGKYVVRVIYLEDPRRPLPMHLPRGEHWFDVAPGQDVLRMADVLGRPVAILRMGGRVPLDDEAGAAANPPWISFEANHPR